MMNHMCVFGVTLIVLLWSPSAMSQEDSQIQDLLFKSKALLTDDISHGSSCDMMNELRVWLGNAGEFDTISQQSLTTLRGKKNRRVRQKNRQLKNQMMSSIIVRRGKGKPRTVVQADKTIPVLLSNGIGEGATFFVATERVEDTRTASADDHCGSGSFLRSSDLEETSCPQLATGSVLPSGRIGLQFTAPSCGCFAIRGLVLYKTDNGEKGHLISPESTQRKRLEKKICVKSAKKIIPKRGKKGQIKRAFRLTKRNLQVIFDGMIEQEIQKINGDLVEAETEGDLRTENLQEIEEPAGNNKNKRRRNKNKRGRGAARLRTKITKGLNICCRTAIANDETPEDKTGLSSCPIIPQDVLSRVESRLKLSQDGCHTMHDHCCLENRNRDLYN